MDYKDFLRNLLVGHRMYRLIMADLLVPLYFLTKGDLFYGFMVLLVVVGGNYAVYELKYKGKVGMWS